MYDGIRSYGGIGSFGMLVSLYFAALFIVGNCILSEAWFVIIIFVLFSIITIGMNSLLVCFIGIYKFMQAANSQIELGHMIHVFLSDLLVFKIV